MTNAQPPPRQSPRDAWLRQSDDALLADCAVDAYRASGPGGQKRNKTSSAIRLRHQPSGLLVISEESRSQHENKRRAVRRLRMAIAIGVRTPTDPATRLPADLQAYILPDGRIRIAETNESRPQFVAFVLDCLVANAGSISDVADAVESSSSQLIRLLMQDGGAALAAANKIRTAHGFRPLRPQSSGKKKSR